jgi:hypothetical protein
LACREEQYHTIALGWMPIHPLGVGLLPTVTSQLHLAGRLYNFVVW